MIPGQRNAAGQLFALPGPAPVGSPFRAGVANSNDGQVYVSDGAAGWTPADLFIGGEQGVWYDPSDMSTMFQDSAGTIPVTAAGQPIGLILDKSKGLALGSELLTNGSFDAGTSGWSAPSAATLSVVEAGSVDMVKTVPAGTSVSVRDVTTIAGNWYKASFTLQAISGTAVQIFCGVYTTGGVTDLSFITVGTTGTFSVYFVAAASSTEVRFGLADGNAVNNTVRFYDVSCKLIAGNHAFQATAAARPLAALTGVCKWTDYDAVDDVMNTSFVSSLGSSCTVARANVGAAPTILTGQTIGTSYAQSVDNAGLVIIDRALTAQETTDLTAYLLAKGATS